MTPQNKPTINSDEWPDVQSAVALKMDEIQKELAVLKTEDHYKGCSTHTLTNMKKKMMKQQRQKANEMVKLNSQLKIRNEAFEPHFLKLKQCLHGLVQYCRPKWGVHFEFSAADSSPLNEPIRLMVDDPQLDRAFTHTMTLNHRIGALILQLAINIAIGSQFIIIDSLDAFIEPCLIKYVKFQLILKRIYKLKRQHEIFWFLCSFSSVQSWCF